MAGTKRGQHLFTWITQTVKNRTSFYNTKQIIQQKKTIKTTTAVDILKDKIRDNIQSIENLLREGQIDSEFEESDISEKNHGYKATVSIQESNEQAGENGKKKDNAKPADKYYNYELLEYPQRKVKPIRYNKDNHQTEVITGKEKDMGHKYFPGMGPDPDYEKRLELPIHAIRVGLKNFNPDTQHKDNYFDKRKVNIKTVQKRYEIKTVSKSDEEDFDRKKDMPNDSEQSSSEKHDIGYTDKKYIGKIIHKTTVFFADVEEKTKNLPKTSESDYERRSEGKVSLIFTEDEDDKKIFIQSEGSYPQNSGLKSTKSKRVLIKKDYFVDNLRFRNNQTKLSTKHKGKERKLTLEYRRRIKPRITRKNNRNFFDTVRNTRKATDNIATVIKVAKHKHKEMALNESLHKFFRNVDIIAYIATRTPKHNSTPMMHEEEDEEAVLKKNIYKAMKKLLRR